MIKRKSMLGRRNRAQQSPSTFQSQSQTFSLERPMDVPRQTDKPIPDPFSTPASMNGSLSNIGAASWEPWSVFKNVRGLSSAGKRNNTILPSPKPSVSTIRRHYQQKTADRQATTKTPNETRQLSSSAAPSCVALYPRALKTPILSHPLPRMASGSEDDAELLQPSRSGREVPTISIEAPSDEIKSDSGSSQELSNLKKQWDTQDIRNVSPPWSNGLNTLTDFNFHTPAQPTSQGRKLENADSPFDVFPQDHTIIPKNSNHDEPEKIETTYTVLEKTTQQDVDGTIDLRTALCDVSLGVYSLDVLDKHNMVKMSQPNWGSKFKQPLPRLSEGPEASKENIQPTNAELSPLRDELEETISDSSEDPDNGIDEKGNPPSVMMQIRDRLAVLNSKIEGVNKGILQAEQKRRQAEEERSQKEEERRVLESEKKKILEDLMESMDRPQMFGLPSKKRRIVPSTVKKGPSFVASKILKRDCKSPRVFVDPNMRTPNHKGRSSMKFNLYTPKSLGKTLNQQFDCLFKSEG